MCEQLVIPWVDQSEKTTPEERVYMTLHWIKAHPDLYVKLKQICVEEEANEAVNRLQRGDVFYIAKRRGLSASGDARFRFSNTMWPALSRFMIMDNPELARVIKPAECEIDKLDFSKMWHDVIGPHSFSVSDWRLACNGRSS